MLLFSGTVNICLCRAIVAFADMGGCVAYAREYEGRWMADIVHASSWNSRIPTGIGNGEC
jgi:hypothetical protein